MNHANFAFNSQKSLCHYVGDRMKHDGDEDGMDEDIGRASKGFAFALILTCISYISAFALWLLGISTMFALLLCLTLPIAIIVAIFLFQGSPPKDKS